jgi:GNAT superfamily N-acetyltransferase
LRNFLYVPGVALTIKPVKTRRELKRFVKVPFGLHRNHPQWVAPLIFERLQFLDRSRNPFFEHAESDFFIAERDGEPVGRITAQVDERWDEFQGGSDGMFGFFETTDDPAVAAALLDTASEWVAGHGRERILGPMDFTTNDEVGLLVEGYELRPMILQPWHPPFYRELIEGRGFAKTMDLWMWWLALGELKEGNEFHPMIHAAAEKVESEHGITVRNMNKRDLRNEVHRFMEVYNEAWGTNWGFVPVTEEEVSFQAKNLKQVLEERWTFIAERDGEVLGASLTLPDINQALAKLNGRLLPFGWLRFLLAKRKIDNVRVFALGVKPEYQHTGIAAAFYIRHLEEASPDRVYAGETGWILEVNEPMNRAMEGMGGKVVKKYRLYEKSLRD